jgi:Ran GTPase-activating protein (RanGAP) involved in mRNA processing and transport
VLFRILNCMPPNARLETANVSRRFASLLGRPEAFAVLDFSAPLTHLTGGPVVPLSDAALAALCRRAGSALRVLDTTGDCCAVTGGGVEAALCGSDGIAGANLETLATCAFADDADVTAASGVGFLRARPLVPNALDTLFTPLQLRRVRDGCPRLRHATVGAVASAAHDETGVAAYTLKLLASLPHGGRTALCVLLPRRRWVEKQQSALSLLGQSLRSGTRLHALALLRENRHPLVPARGSGTPPANHAYHDNGEEEDDDDNEQNYDGMDGYDDEPFRPADDRGTFIAALLQGVLRENATLAALDVSYCGMGDTGCLALKNALLHAHAGDGGLRELHVTQNGITAEPGAFMLGEVLQGNGTLRKLCVGGNLLCGSGCALLAGALASTQVQALGLQLVTHPDAENGAIRVVDAAATLLAAPHTALTALDLSSNAIYDVRPLAAPLAANTTLRELDLSCNELHPVGLAMVTTALRTNRTLAKLSLRPNTMQLMIMGLRGGGALSFSAGALSGEPAQHWVVALGAALRRACCALRELDLRSALHSEADAACIMEALCDNASLTQLDVSGCQHFAGARVTRSLRDALRRPTCPLVKLAMGQNPLSAADVQHLAAGLRDNTSLKEVVLAQCGVCARGAAALASALAVNTTLVSVDLMQNNIGDAGAAALAAALRANNTLRMLGLFRPTAPWECSMFGAMRGAPAQNRVSGRAEEELRRAAARRGVLIGHHDDA